MKGDHWVLHDVTHVDHLPIAQHVWMFRQHKPTHVGEEETSPCVVWVSVCFAEFVVHPVVTYPIEYRILSVSEDVQYS
jgi:hypothetical protein